SLPPSSFLLSFFVSSSAMCSFLLLQPLVLFTLRPFCVRTLLYNELYDIDCGAVIPPSLILSFVVLCFVFCHVLLPSSSTSCSLYSASVLCENTALQRALRHRLRCGHPSLPHPFFCRSLFRLLPCAPSFFFNLL